MILLVGLLGDVVVEFVAVLIGESFFLVVEVFAVVVVVFVFVIVVVIVLVVVVVVVVVAVVVVFVVVLVVVVVVVVVVVLVAVFAKKFHSFSKHGNIPHFAQKALKKWKKKF